jgi:hypothetical protein
MNEQAPLTRDYAAKIFADAFRKDPGYMTRALGDGDASPLRDMLASPVIDLVQQALPGNVGETGWGSRLFETVAGDAAPESWRTKAAQALAAVPLGGYDQRRKERIARARQEDPTLRHNTLELGKVPAMTGPGEVSTKGRPSLAATQAAGVIAGDLTTDGLRNAWWFLNAPQALSVLATLSVIHSQGQQFREEAGLLNQGPLIRSRRMRMAATAPAWIGMSAAIGNAVRQPGYGAVIPAEGDRTKSENPVLEGLSRFFLGRTGNLLPYEDFVKERPDVSRGEYERYKQYLFESDAPLKATLEGINGPEVTFMGKSIPVATGLLPAVAGVVGAGWGIRKAGQSLRRSNQLARLRGLNEERAEARSALWRAENPRDDEKYSESDVADARRQYEQASHDYHQQEKVHDSELVKSALLHSGGALAGTAALGLALEALRRGMPDADSAQTSR